MIATAKTSYGVRTITDLQDRCIVDDITGCWLWRAARDSNGTPSLQYPPLGRVVGIYLLTFIASNAGDEFKFKEVLILSIALAVTSYLAFIKLLNLQFRVWPAFITG